MGEMRADRFLSVTGAASRSEAKKAIRAGRLKRNGVPVTRPEEKLNLSADELEFDGMPLTYEEYEYWALNKPAGIISATEDLRHETVISYMGLKRKGMAPCGRLDINTTGLLLVTDDGEMVHRLLSPARHVEKGYEVQYEGTLPEGAAERVARGLTLEDGTVCMPARLQSTGMPALLFLKEGKFHQVKRMFAALGCPVTGLKRISFGPLKLDEMNLGEGAFRKLNAWEILQLKTAAGTESEDAL